MPYKLLALVKKSRKRRGIIILWFENFNEALGEGSESTPLIRHIFNIIRQSTLFEDSSLGGDLNLLR